MNIPFIPLAHKQLGESIRCTGFGMAAGIASLAWSLSGSVANAQQPRTMQHEGRSFAVVPAAEMSSVFETSGEEIIVSEFDQNFPLIHGSQIAAGSCSGSQCPGNCGSPTCGGGGLHGGGFFGHRQNSCNDGCATCNPFCYGRVEAVYMQRDGLDNFTRSRSPAMLLDEPNFEAAPRITIGTAPDCVTGYEASFVGPLNFDTNRTAVGRSGQTLLTQRTVIPAAPPVPGLQVDEVFSLYGDPVNPDATLFQRYRTEFWSVEASRTSLAWDIAKLLIGVRYIRLDEQYDLIGADPTAGQSGAIYSKTTNDLIGMQIGGDIFTPVCRSTSAYFRGRGGLYYNNAGSTALVSKDATLLYGIRDNHDGFAAMFEFGGGLQYQISEMFSVHGGGELWYLTKVATAADQIPTIVGDNIGAHGTRASDDIFFAGFNVGATMKY
ncbi:hypothetical protein [Allorhodopirellula heiligendammensis]|uniref:Uncharacterized protein n=1 Tax=Allorhodopirellula heiligendammensis TaxID=2714739 RepID=A0A5C6C3N5_9BACT|nr:hypothetical protein [Allorhodopirellula heiligendammensis]TWU19123.1 hypothetical protein Poly21_12940 [Allorhodopirellula heiligendammensis]